MNALERGKLIKPDGKAIPYIWNVRPEHKLVLLCLHGYVGSKESNVITALRESLDAKGIGVVTFDWPAHGESEVPDADLTVENCLVDMETVLAWLHERVNVPISCFATSFGGYLATIYRHEYPEVFQHLILRSPALKMAEILRGLLTEQEFTALMAGEEIVQGFDRKIKIGKAFYESLCRHDAYTPVPPHTENMLILQGDADAVVDPQDTIAYAHKNDIQLVLFPGADHFYQDPGEKERIVSETEAFLQNAE